MTAWISLGVAVVIGLLALMWRFAKRASDGLAPDQSRAPDRED